MTSARVWSLWDMLKPFRNREIFGSLTYLAQTQRRLSDAVLAMDKLGPTATFKLHPHEIEEIPSSLGNFALAGEEFEIPGVAAAADEAYEIYLKAKDGPMTRADVNRLSSALMGLQLTFVNVIKDILLLNIGRDSVRYYSGDRLGFGQDVEDKFPSSKDDGREASRCRALERWTASVMHSMRALEAPLLAFAKDVLKKPPKKENWHEVLKEIEEEIEKQKKAGKHSKFQFESEAANYFRHIKDAWRNHAMHAKTFYGEDDAIEIYDATRSLMRHLSKRFSEAS